MLRGLTAKQFIDWQAYEELNPFSDIKDDYRTASVRYTIANMWRSTEKHPEPFPLTDFLLKWGDEAKEKSDGPKATPQKTWQQLKLMGQVLAASYNMMEEADREKKAKREQRRKKR